MKPVLIDSDVLIEVSRGRDEVVLERWSQLSGSDVPLLCSPVTVAEIWHGARSHEHKILTALFQVLICLPVDLEIGRKAGEFLRKYHSSHNVELGDALIAAAAVIHEAALWTRNRRPYPMPDLNFL